MSFQAKLNLQLNQNSTGVKSLNSTASNFRSSSHQPSSLQLQHDLITQIYSNQQVNQIKSTLAKVDTIKNMNTHNNSSLIAGQHMFSSIGNSKIQNISQNTVSKDTEQTISQQQQGELEQKHAQQIPIPQITLNNGLQLTQNNRKSIQNKLSNESLMQDFKNQKRISYSHKALNFSPSNQNKQAKNIHLNIGANFQQSQRNSFANNNLSHNNQQQNSIQSTLLQQIQQQSGSGAQWSSSQSPLQNSSISQANSQIQQINFQHVKGVFSPMKSLFKNQNTTDFTQSHAQFNKTFQIQPHSATGNPSALQQLYLQQIPQQPNQQVQSAKNKDLKGPFFFPSSKKQQIIPSNTAVNGSNFSNTNKSIRNASIQELQSYQAPYHTQNQLQTHNSLVSETVFTKGSANNLDLNLLKLEREQLKERIDKLDSEKFDLNKLLTISNQIKDLAILQLKRLIEQKAPINLFENDCFKNILQMEQQYVQESLSQADSLTNLVKQSPNSKALAEFRKASLIKQNQQPIEDIQSYKSTSQQPRSSLPTSPKRKIHFDKVKDKVIQISSFDKTGKNKTKFSNNDSNNMNKTTNVSQNTGNNLSNNLTHQNSLANQVSGHSSSNITLYNHKFSSEDNTKNTSQIIGMIQPAIMIQEELQKIKLRMIEVLKLKSQCPMCSKKSISLKPHEEVAQNAIQKNQINSPSIQQKGFKFTIQRKSECINLNDIQKINYGTDSEKDKIKSYR
ncbi:hypothetical protein TTHERM_00925750 (macronuclear) [Tetrahymena thermophila SB210]|uniref:Uncharacterized protein n=1 Tax=Tetrahymena thermophila (strain SB210) TaxID=312017 RepID=Q22DY4_TETTS|nr:hypothetical protein TTHERM_00925750 [Tetrahymena thermophila SB210]EAR83528.2 hypothetical protein TTHERM_00925750 [Tetrahymena thermophila SB210]|eukprot:XP_001031191.2 hypothetical protein TTHERM_00925750 [Tetrahymena thermophila SB210]